MSSMNGELIYIFQFKSPHVDSGSHVGQHIYTEVLVTFFSLGVAIVTKVLWKMPRADGVDSI